MPVLDMVCQELAQIAPLRLAESWDNVGLLVGNRQQDIGRIMTCLTISPPVVNEAVSEQADLLISHHPLPFKPLKKITSDNITGKMLLQLIGSGTAVYSAHTAYDSAESGINQAWTDAFSLSDINPLMPPAESDQATMGSGRYGTLPAPTPLRDIVAQAADLVGATIPRYVGDADKPVKRLGFACGSGGSFLAAAIRKGCDALITGEATFHTCLEAQSSDIGLGLVGHYWSERFAMESMADELAAIFPKLTIWPSQMESDPITPLKNLIFPGISNGSIPLPTLRCHG